MPTEVKQQLFSVDETSTILGCSVSSTWRAMREKRLEVVYLGGSTKIKGESIDRLIAGAAPKPEDRISIRRTRQPPPRLRPRPQPSARRSSACGWLRWNAARSRPPGRRRSAASRPTPEWP
jgi:hypothetical protein